MTGPATLRVLEIERRLDSAPDWIRPDWPRLWLYNAHYFDDLVARESCARNEWHRQLIARWINENLPGESVGWEPYPTSLRIVNWLKWLLIGNAPVPGMLDSLVVQVRWLRGRMERHLQGNHLWANSKALVFAGACFEGEEADGWLRQGLSHMKRELREQVLPDGGHFERSPMYHSILTEDLLDLVQLARIGEVIDPVVVSQWREIASRMLDWAATMAHPDGDVSFFNDAAFGIAPNLPALQAYAAAVGVVRPTIDVISSLRLLQASGYARLESGSAVLLADVAPVGPDHLPGHAHADTLSFELSISGRRVLVNGGTSTYEIGPERLRQRGTAAHNTVVVDGQDSSEVWSAFRVGQRRG